MYLFRYITIQTQDTFEFFPHKEVATLAASQMNKSGNKNSISPFAGLDSKKVFSHFLGQKGEERESKKFWPRFRFSPLER